MGIVHVVIGRDHQIDRKNGKMNKWQPIETAPKDIGAIIGSNGQWVLAMRWATNGMAWTSEYHRSAVVPTHWMPLPEPPKEKE